MTYNLENYIYDGYIVPFEVWKPITQEMVPNVRPIYFISNIGNVYNSETNSYFNKTLTPNAYVNITLQTIKGEKVNALIHRLVCMAFNGMPTNSYNQVDHVNGSKTCNYEENLEWVNSQENTIRAVRNGLKQTCEDCYNSIFTNDEVIEICNMLLNHVPINNICSIMEQKILPRSYSNIKKIIFDILNKRSWTNITKNYTFPKYTTSAFSDCEVEEICKLLESGCNDFNKILISINRYSEDEDINKSLRQIISAIKNKFRYLHISSKYNIQKGRKYTLTTEEYNYVYNSISKGMSPKDIIKSMGERGESSSVKQAVYRISSEMKR